MKVIYLAHPLNAPTREGIEQNRANASKWCAWAARHGVAPIATWIILSGEWEETEENRRLGLEIDIALVARCDEVWLVGGRISTGMAIEAREAQKLGIPLRDLTHLGALPPADAEGALAKTLPPPRDPFSESAMRETAQAARDPMATLDEEAESARERRNSRYDR